MDVVSKEGLLFLQGVKFGKKIWRKCWLIVFEPSPVGIGRMELYDVRDAGGVTRPAALRKADKRVIRLTDCLSITPAPGESCPTGCSAFFLNTTSCTYTIAAPTREDWISTLCQLAFQKSQRGEDPRKDKYGGLANNELYSTWGAGQFQVTVQTSDASQRCRISGSYLLSAEKEAVCLLDLKSGQSIYSWPYRLLRRFSQVKGGLMIEAGRRCHTGEGQFIFLSKQSSQIHRAIEEAIMHQSVQELLAQATASQPTAPDRPQGKKPPPVSAVKEHPKAPFQCKHGQQLHKAIKEALAHKSLQELPAPPTSPRPQTLPRVNKHPPGRTDRPCLPAPPTHRLMDGALKHSSCPPPPLPPPLPKNKPTALKLPAAPRDQDRPCPTPRRNISLPDPPVKSPDEVLYSVIFPQPKPRAKLSLPRVLTPPSLAQHFRIPEPDVEREQESACEMNTEAPYTNWAVRSGGEHHIEDLYSTVDFAAKRRNRQNEDNEIPADFKQTLSNVLFKDASKFPPSFLPRSHGGSCDRLDTTEEKMTE